MLTNAKRVLAGIVLVSTAISLFSQNSENCIDFTNLYSPNTTCRYGTFSNPNQSIGVMKGRHTLMTDKYQKDANTNNQLSVVPPGESKSIRLGNSNVGAEAESITYKYTVDTNERDLLILKYAAVMENPSHIDSEQPRFTFSILNSNMQLIDQCYFANFVASASLGWNQVKTGSGWSSSNVLWKDWTTIGVDLSEFHGQTIYVSLTTYDCLQGGHFGYAYFTLSCDKKVMIAENCGNTVENTFTPPNGFDYTWYNAENPSKVLSTNQSLHVTEQGEYIVKCSFVGNSGCYFYMSAFAGERYPFASYDYEIVPTGDCTTKVKFTNNSIVTSDSAHKIFTTQQCDEFLWDFGDGTVSTEENPTHIYNTHNYKSEYNVRLTAYLSGKKCEDTIIKVINSQPCQIDTIYIGLCPKESIVFNDTIVLKEDGTYQIDSFEYRKIVTIFHYPTYDTLIEESICYGQKYNKNGFDVTAAGYYTDSLKSINGCDSVVHLQLTINSTYNLSLFDTICYGETYSENGFSGTTAGEYVKNLQTINGCDSIVTLDLFVNPTFDSTYFDTICQGETCTVYNFNETTAGIHIKTLQTINGCDSVVRLHLCVNPIYDTTIVAEICTGEYYNQYNFNEKEQGEYIQELKSIYSCDSIIRLKLHENPTFDTLIYDTICANEFYTLNNFSENIAGTYIQNLQTIKGCDSIVTLELFVNPIYDTIYFDTICNKDTYMSYNFSETNSGFYTQELQNMYGCDSIVKLDLYVNPDYATVIDAEICNGAIYTQNNFSESKQGEYIQELKTVNGCDSVVILNLVIHSIYDSVINADICDGETYSENNFNQTQQGFYTDSLFSIYGCDSVVHLDLTTHPNYYDTIIAEICSNETYYFYNFNENSQGIYSQNLNTIHGCDSIITLDLTVHQAYYDTIDATIAEGKIYDRNGFYEKDTGTYYQYSNTMYGCDSNTILILSVDEPLEIWTPNIITPTDATNNYFTVYYDPDEVDPDLLIIYNRWGGKVYETKDITKRWDGRYKDTYVQTGVYKFDLYYHKKGNKNKRYRKVGEFMVAY